MESRLYGSALALGLAAWVCGVLLTQSGRSRHGDVLRLLIPSAWRIAAFVIPLLGFAATLPTHAPFAVGQGLGKGLLLGMAGAMLSAWTMTRIVEMDALNGGQGRRNAPAFLAPFGLAVVVACVPLLWMRSVVADALLGTAMGWLTASFLLLAGLNARGAAGRAVSLGLTATAGFAATVCALGAVGEYGGNIRFGAALLPVPYSAVLMPLAAALPLVLMLCALYRRQAGASSLSASPAATLKTMAQARETGVLRWFAGSAALLFVGAQFAHKLAGQPNLFRLLGLGLLAGGLAWWLLTNQAMRGRTGLNGRSLALPVLLLMAAGMVAFQMLAGVGWGVMLLGAWLAAGLALAATVEEGGTALYATGKGETSDFNGASVTAQLLRLMLFGALLLLYRLFQVRYEADLHNVLLPDHYALLGFLVGVAAPAALAGSLHAGVWHRSVGREDVYEITRPSLLKLIAAGGLSLLLPGLLLVLFGTKCLLCLFFGLALSAVVGDVTRAGEDGEKAERSAFQPLGGELLTGLFALAMGLACAQWTRHVLPYGLMARADKVHLLTMGTGAAAVLLLVSEIGAYLNRLNSPPLSRPYEAAFDTPAARKETLAGTPKETQTETQKETLAGTSKEIQTETQIEAQPEMPKGGRL